MFAERLRRSGWIVLILAGCNGMLPPPPPPKLRTAPPVADSTNSVASSKNSEVPRGPNSAPEHFHVKFETSKGDFVVDVHRHWAPHGVDRFHQLVKEGFFDECRFFRVVPGFVVQWGLGNDPAANAKYQQSTIPDDDREISNTRGTLTFAKSDAPNSRSSQLFINFKDNSQSLDSQNFAPFGKVIQGMEDVVDQITSEYGEEPDQATLGQVGNTYLEAKFPNLDYIIKATILSPDGKSEPAEGQ